MKPSLVELADDLGRPRRAVRAALRRCEAGPDVGLKLLEACAEGRQVALDDRGEDLEQHDAAETLGQALGDRGELREGPQLVVAMQAMPAGRLDDEDRPVIGEVQPGQEWRDLALLLPAAVDDEPAVPEAVQTDAGAVAPTRESGQLLRPRGRGSRQVSRWPTRPPG